ncbi:hypothetical protein Tco_0172242, partial [Tanacetum coccineum]
YLTKEILPEDKKKARAVRQKAVRPDRRKKGAGSHTRSKKQEKDGKVLQLTTIIKMHIERRTHPLRLHTQSGDSYLYPKEGAGARSLTILEPENQLNRALAGTTNSSTQKNDHSNSSRNLNSWNSRHGHLDA